MCNMYFGRRTEEELKAVIDSPKMPYTASCFAQYPNYYKVANGKEFVFGFYAEEEIDKLIEEINTLFENVKINVISKRMLEFKGDSEFYDKDKCYHYIFTVDISDKYSPKSAYALKLSIAMFIRAYCPEYDHWAKLKKLPELKVKNPATYHIIKCLKAANETGQEYGNWLGGKIKCTMTDFVKLDNILIMNEASKTINIELFLYLSRFFEVLKNIKRIDAGYVIQDRGW